MLFSRVSQALCSIVCLVVFSFSSPASARADQVQIISTNANDFDVHSAYSKIAAIGNGQFISTWIESQGNQFSPGSPLYFSSYIPTQGWSRPTVVVKSESPTDPINISYLQAFGDSDVAFIFWYQSGNRQQTGTYYAVISNGVIEEIKFLDQDLSTRDLSVAFDKKGHGVLVYTKTRVVTISEEGSERQETQAQQYVSYIENHRIAEPQVLTPWGRPKGPMIFSAAELNQSQKRLTAVWLEVGPSSYPGNFSNRTLKKFVILARTYDSTQGWSDTSEVAVEEESDPFGPPQSITNLKVSSAPNGQAMVSYFKLMPEGPQATPYRPVPVVSHRTTYGTWSTPTQVPELLESVNVASTSYPKDLQIAISSNGKQIIVWNNVCDERGVLREQQRFNTYLCEYLVGRNNRNDRLSAPQILYKSDQASESATSRTILQLLPRFDGTKVGILWHRISSGRRIFEAQSYTFEGAEMGPILSGPTSRGAERFQFSDLMGSKFDSIVDEDGSLGAVMNEYHVIDINEFPRQHANHVSTAIVFQKLLAHSECQDTVDNDQDGKIDQADPGCWTDVNKPGTYDKTLDDESRADPVGEVVQIAPTNNSIIYDHSPTIQWESLSGAQHYELWIKQLAPKVVEEIVRVNNLTSTNYVAKDLPTGEYIWFVRAVSRKGVVGPWQSPTTSFRFTIVTECSDTKDNDADGLTDLADPGCQNNREGNDESRATSQCQDGIDNDVDGALDYPSDFSCKSKLDNDEQFPKSECQDLIDNDKNGFIDLKDAGCSSQQDNSESGFITQCQDGIDNDGDGFADLQDFACDNAQDDDEGDKKAQCQDDMDNDQNGFIDEKDPGCKNSQDNDENGYRTQCSDTIDNDLDGAIDYPLDFSCDSALDNDESDPQAQCQDGIDNDEDLLVDLADPGCSSSQDNNEGDGTSQCRDALDNDLDGLIDGFDPGCDNPQDNDESDGTSQCQDAIDNDGDGLTDFGSDPDCTSKQDDNEAVENKYYVCNIEENFDDGKIDQVSLVPFGRAGDTCKHVVLNEKLVVRCPEDAGYRIFLNGSSSHSSADVTLSAEITSSSWRTAEGPALGLSQFSITKGFHINMFAPSVPNGNKPYHTGKAIIYNGINETVYGTHGVNVGEGYHSYRAFVPGSQSPTASTALTVAQYDAIFGTAIAGHLGNPGWELAVVVSEADYEIDNIKARIVSRAPIPCALQATQCSDQQDNDSDGLIDSADPGCADELDDDESDKTSQCQDGIDNDTDIAIDAMDPGCWTDASKSETYDRLDNDESDATTQCQDNRDNDGDAVVDKNDPGCWTDSMDPNSYDPTDDLEGDGTTQCQDNIDNDEDGAIDLEDFSCGGDNTRNTEATPRAQCQDTLDNDGDMLIDRDDPGCATPQGNNEGSLTTQCQDGIDNDEDGAVDLDDYSCLGDITNDDESAPLSQCQDQRDNDQDNLIDLVDPGCESKQDNNEGDGTTECQDGIDNDGDGATDMDDFSCQGDNTKDDEANPQSQCQDGIDNDGDQVTDLDDPGCESNQDNNEGDGTTACQDTFDNDRDGVADAADPGCWKNINDAASYDPTDRDEGDATTQCQDGLDNDEDGLTDLDDPGCSSPQDYNEGDGTSECQDGNDNDQDLLVDATDPGCWLNEDDPSSYEPTDNNEGDATTECQDGLDNDGDSLIDAKDPGCFDDVNDPNTYNPVDDSEADSVDKTCSDGLDNDNDGLTDAQDPDCWSNESDPNSYNPTNPTGENTPQFSPCEQPLRSLRDKANIAGIAIYELSGKVTRYLFNADGAEIGSDIEQSADQNDFTTVEKEYYDVLVSDSDGNLDIEGSYLTVQALSKGIEGIASNIDAVALVMKDGSEIPAEIISKVLLGNNLSTQVLADSGFAKLALGAADQASTILGDGQTSITLGFCEALSDPCTVGDKCTCDAEINISELLMQARGDDQYEFILQESNKIKGNKIFKNNREVRWDTKRRIRRGWIRILKLHKILLGIPSIITTSCPAEVNCASVSNSDNIEKAKSLVTKLWKIGRNTITLMVKKKLITKNSAKPKYKLIEEYRDARLNALSQVPDQYLSCE